MASPQLVNEAVRLGIISSHADYRRSDYMFEREQRRTLREMAWEAKAAPVRGWGYDLACAVPLVVFILTILVVT